MLKQSAIVDQPAAEGKYWPLTAEEVAQLMQVFTRGKTEVLEQDCLILCQWAEVQKFGAYVLFLVLEGRVAVSVEAGTVTLGPLAPHLPRSAR